MFICCYITCVDTACSLALTLFVSAPARPCFFGVSRAWILWYGCFLQSHYCCFLQSLCFADKIAGCSDSLSTVRVPCMCRQVPCFDMCGYSTSAKAWGVGDTSPARGRPVANLLLCLYCRGCVFQVTSCVLLSVRVYLSCWAWSDFPTGGGAPGLFCLATSMSAHPAHHVHTVRPQLASVSSCALQ
jgi:hypothetical protein